MRHSLWVLILSVVVLFSFSPAAEAADLTNRIGFPATVDLTYGAAGFNQSIKGYSISHYAGHGQAVCRPSNPARRSITGASANIAISLQSDGTGAFDHFSSLYTQLGAPTTPNAPFASLLSFTRRQFFGFGGPQFGDSGEANKDVYVNSTTNRFFDFFGGKVTTRNYGSVPILGNFNIVKSGGTTYFRDFYTLTCPNTKKRFKMDLM